MAEYIEREAAINAVFEAYADGRSAYIALEAIPAADVAPVRHGRWILKDDGRAHCSECDTAGNSYVWHYCPNCGARMDKDGYGE